MDGGAVFLVEMRGEDGKIQLRSGGKGAIVTLYKCFRRRAEGQKGVSGTRGGNAAGENWTSAETVMQNL